MSLALSPAGVPTRPNELTATDALAAMRERRLSCEELMRACLGRVADRDTAVRAWIHLDPDEALRDARARDKASPDAALHGLPWGVKDVFDTASLPTTQNSVICAGVRPARDAACIAVLRACGSLVLGKTDTVEFAANGRKALTRNPHDLSRTPGGSSSGSAAAVADFHVPLALGSQTIGSLVRPASFTGIYAFKPTWGAVSREGMKANAPSLDTVGWYARCAADLGLVARQFSFFPSAADPPASAKGLRVGLCQSPMWDGIEPAGEAALVAAAQRLRDAGARVEELALPPAFDALHDALTDVYHWEGGRSFLSEKLVHGDVLAPALRAQVDNARGTTAADLAAAYEIVETCRRGFDRVLDQRFDLLLTPSSPGHAPAGLETTGSSIFNGLWTALHVPCVSVPADAPGGLPMGVTLVGRRFRDLELIDQSCAVGPILDRYAG